MNHNPSIIANIIKGCDGHHGNPERSILKAGADGWGMVRLEPLSYGRYGCVWQDGRHIRHGFDRCGIRQTPVGIRSCPSMFMRMNRSDGDHPFIGIDKHNNMMNLCVNNIMEVLNGGKPITPVQ